MQGHEPVALGSRRRPCKIVRGSRLCAGLAGLLCAGFSRVATARIWESSQVPAGQFGGIRWIFARNAVDREENSYERVS